MSHTKKSSVSGRLKAFLACDLEQVEHLIFSPGSAGAVDIVTIAWNTPAVIKLQAKYLKKYVRDDYVFTVVDNSTDTAASQAIWKFCKRKRINIIRLPDSGFKMSESHGAALQWAYQNFLASRPSRWFGFIDHDVFPYKPVSFQPTLRKQKIYGHLVDIPGGGWYIWPGLCFFERRLAESLDFWLMPAQGRDTGAAMWDRFYHSLDFASLKFLRFGFIRIGQGDEIYQDYVQYIGPWVHLLNASNWKPLENRSDRARNMRRFLWWLRMGKLESRYHFLPRTVKPILVSGTRKSE